MSEERRGEVVVPEVLPSLEDAGPGGVRPRPEFRRVDVALGPGCGCLAIPAAVLGAVIASCVIALAWVLRIVETVRALAAAARRALGGRGGGRGGA